MSAARHIGVFHGVGHDYGAVLRTVRGQEPEAAICAIVPAGYPVAEVPRDLADEVMEMELAHYAPWRLGACLRLVRRLRAERFDRFIVMFDSAQLRVLAAFTGAPERVWCPMNLQMKPLPGASLVGAAVGEVARRVRGCSVYAFVWLMVHLTRTPEPSRPNRTK